MDRTHFCTADCVGTAPPEMFSLEQQQQRLVLSSELDLRDELRSALDAMPEWLPIAAETLNISPDIKDYVLTPVISMPSDLPNWNQQAFPLTELTRWVTDHGQVMYRTWSGKSAFEEHQNNDPSKAKGVILHTMLRPIANSAGDIWKVIKLVAWDRQRDPVLANDILTKKRCHYSMGAMCNDYSCTICGASLNKGGCEHLEHGKPNFRVFNGRLAYFNVVNPVGFELSVVSSPAYYSASNMPFFTW